MKKMPIDLENTYAGKVYQAVTDKYYSLLNDNVINVEIADICEFLLLHNEFLKDQKIVTETSQPQNDTEKHYQELLVKMKQIIDLKHKFDNALNKLQDLYDYNDEDSVNSAVKEIFKK